MATFTRSLFNTLDDLSRTRPAAPAIIEAFNGNRSISYAELYSKAMSVASYLRARSFAPGDRASVIVPNCIELSVFTLGVWAAGGVIVGSSIASKKYELSYELRDTEATVVLTTAANLENVSDAISECSRVKAVIVIGASEKPLPDGIVPFFEITESYDVQPLTETLSDELIIFYSSGTTGLRKGVIHTQTSFNAAIENVRRHWTDEIYPAIGVPQVDWKQEFQLIAVPCCYLMGFTMLHWFLKSGSPVVLLRNIQNPSLQQALDAFKPKFIIGHPTMVKYLHENRIDLAPLKMFVSSAAPLRCDIAESFLSTHGNVKFLAQAYGMSELIFCNLPRLRTQGFISSSGIVAPTYHQKIVEPATGEECVRGEVGEVCVKGPSMTVGYLNKPEHTEALFTADGWLRTGDLGYLDSYDELHIVDRMKEVFKINHNDMTLPSFCNLTQKSLIQQLLAFPMTSVPC